MTALTHATIRQHLTRPLKSLIIVAICASLGYGQLLVDFDGGDTTAYSVTSSSGDFTPTVLEGGPSGNFLRLIDKTNSNNNSVALDEVAAVSGPAPNGKTLGWDFRMDGTADGIGIGYFATGPYGATGPSNPAAAEGASVWERPVYPSAAVIGLDVYPNIDVVTLNFFGSELAAVDVQAMGLDLNNGVWHHGSFTVEPDPADSTKALFSINIIADAYGASPVEHSVLADFPVDIDLGTLPLNRVIAGGRTGGEVMDADLDNITVNYIPEPSSLMLIGIASLGLLTARRRVR